MIKINKTLWIGLCVLIFVACAEEKSRYIETFYVNNTQSEIKVKVFRYSEKDHVYNQVEDEIFLHSGECFFVWNYYDYDSAGSEYIAHTLHRDSIVAEKDGKYIYSTKRGGTIPRSMFLWESYQLVVNNGKMLANFHFYESDFANAVAVGE